MIQRSLAALLAGAAVAVAPVICAAGVSAKGGVHAAQPAARTVVTHGGVVVGGKRIDYTATAGTIILRNKAGKPTASMFYVAYTQDGVRDMGRRPVTFAYNGGPGFASALVDVGGFGPRRIEWPAPGQIQAEQPPYRLVPNAYSILKTTDLVFIDAVGTGYSRIIGAGKPAMFYGINGDARSFTQFIERYIQRNGRFESPKFLLGESYGTTRSAVLAQDLVAKGVYLDGVILCSSVLDFPTLNFTPGNDLPYELYLPSYAAVAWYHHRLEPQPPHLVAFVHEVEDFAGGTYAHALFEGSALTAARKAQIAARLARYTGLPAALWERADLRIPPSVFQRRVLGDATTTARFDGRFSTPELQPLMPEAGDSAAGASMTAIWGALTAGFESYLHHVLDYHSDRIYVQSSATPFRDWDWKRYQPPLSQLDQGVGTNESVMRVEDVAPSLARAMSNDPGMQLMLNNGWFDMATPFFALNYTIAHMGLPAVLEPNIHEYYYPVGHMLYLNPAALPQVSRNIDAFITGAVGRG